MTYQRLEEILHEYYLEVYRRATPSADYDELVRNATINERGDKTIDMDAYVLSEEVMSDIVADYIKRYKLKHQYLKTFNFHAWLGPVPRSNPKP